MVDDEIEKEGKHRTSRPDPDIRLPFTKRLAKVGKVARDGVIITAGLLAEAGKPLPTTPPNPNPNGAAAGKQEVPPPKNREARLGNQLFNGKENAKEFEPADLGDRFAGDADFIEVLLENKNKGGKAGNKREYAPHRRNIIKALEDGRAVIQEIDRQWQETHTFKYGPDLNGLISDLKKENITIGTQKLAEKLKSFLYADNEKIEGLSLGVDLQNRSEKEKACWYQNLSALQNACDDALGLVEETLEKQDRPLLPCGKKR